jgi:hypothetical protein
MYEKKDVQAQILLMDQQHLNHSNYKTIKFCIFEKISFFLNDNNN